MAGSEAAPLSVTELAGLVRAADPQAVFVPPRLLRRVIKYDRKLTGIGLQVPHRKCYVLPRDRLLEFVDASELELEAGRGLESTVILLARPDADRLAATPRKLALVQFWRLLFHARVHLALEAKLADHHLTPAAVRERVHRIGQAEFDEIRRVLRQEKLLLPPRDDLTVYEEFAALYLELRCFSPTLLHRYFPTLDHEGQVDAILAEDVDAASLLEAARLAGSPDPVLPPAPAQERAGATVVSVPPSPERRQRLLERAVKASAVGNNVGAALRSAQANPTDIRASAGAELDRLVGRLQRALELKDPSAWKLALPALLEFAAQGVWPVEARLLYDLQKVCVAHERTVYKPDLVGWLKSLGQKPLLEPLPHQHAVLTVKHLRKALRRLPATRLADDRRHELSRLLRQALDDAEERLRHRLGPPIEQAMLEVGFEPVNVPERVAFHKVREELLDRIVERGLLTLGDVRDALSRNQLKLPDLAGARELLHGDAVLRANRRLAEAAKGVYRYGEFYLRWLQRLSATAFGTHNGRLLTLFVAIPLGGSFVLLEGLQYLVNEVLHFFPAGAAHQAAEAVAGAEADARPHRHVHRHPHVHFVNWQLILAFAVFLLLMIHVPRFRAAVFAATRLLGKLLHRLFVDFPRVLLGMSVIRRVLDSRWFRWFANFVLKPGLVTVPAWLVLREHEDDARSLVAETGLVFTSAFLLLNSRLGRDAQEIGADLLTRTWERTRDLLLGLVRLILEVFKTLLEGVDRLLYGVDEWLRYRSGEGRLTLVAKVVLGPLWGMLAYLVRFFLLLFIEPQVNPIKHFPVVTVAHKLLLPLVPVLAAFLVDNMNMEKAVAGTVALLFIGKIPGVFGFLVWELKENWRLYEANRPKFLRAVSIGHHGETMLRFMKPGFHSGTLPKLYGKLRKAERRAQRTGDRRAARKFREALHHVEESIRRFVERELVYLLRQDPSWAGTPLRVHRVDAGSSRIRVELTGPVHDLPLEIAFEERSGWLLAGIARPGWLHDVGPEQKETLETALAGLYKLAGVDMVREQIEACFAPQHPSYDVADEGLVVWPGPGYETEAVYRFDQGPVLRAEVREGKVPHLPDLEASRILFRDVGIAWTDWLAAWDGRTGSRLALAPTGRFRDAVRGSPKPSSARER